MKTRVDERLRDEARRFALRFACEDCAHFDGARCGNGWPGRVARSLDEPGVTEIELCKEFEAR